MTAGNRDLMHEVCNQRNLARALRQQRRKNKKKNQTKYSKKRRRFLCLSYNEIEASDITINDRIMSIYLLQTLKGTCVQFDQNVGVG